MRLILLVTALLAAAPARADQYGGFRQYADSGSVKPFARDLGGVLGSASFHSGRSLGFSGFDVGARGGLQFRPEGGDRILRENGVKAFGLPWVQAEIGMPFRIDGFIRGVSYEGLTVAGGGLRYGLYNASDKPWAPQLLVSGVGHAVVHQHFSAGHVGASLVASIGNSRFTTYLGAGLDQTSLLVRSSADPLFEGTRVKTLESRYTAGLRVKPWNFVYLYSAYVFLHGQSGMEAGLGMRF